MLRKRFRSFLIPIVVFPTIFILATAWGCNSGGSRSDDATDQEGAELQVPPAEESAAAPTREAPQVANDLVGAVDQPPVALEADMGRVDVPFVETPEPVAAKSPGSGNALPTLLPDDLPDADPPVVAASSPDELPGPVPVAIEESVEESGPEVAPGPAPSSGLALPSLLPEVPPQAVGEGTAPLPGEAAPTSVAEIAAPSEAVPPLDASPPLAVEPKVAEGAAGRAPNPAPLSEDTVGSQPSVLPPRPSPFAENPLREGTDDFRPSPEPSPPTEVTSAVIAPRVATSVEPKKRLSKGKKGDGSFDPIKENGPIFVGWEKPKLALVISGRQDGYIEPCGCAGLDRMKGGLTRRHSMFKELRADGWPVLGFDCGGLVKGSGRQAVLKFHMSVDAMQQIGYDAIALGESDLRLPAGELLAKVASSEGAPSMFLSANVAIFGFDMGMTSDHRILEAGGMRVGITSVLGSSWQKEIHNSEIEMADPQEKLRAVLPKLKGKCDLLVLLAHATMEETKSLADAFPEFNIVVTGGGNPQPPEKPEVLPGNRLLIEVGEKGMDAIVLGIYEGDKIRYQRVPLDSRFEDSPEMIAFMRHYQDELKAIGLEGLGIRRPFPPHPQAEENGGFVGSKKCADCHDISYDVWKDSGHSDAWKTLVNLEVPRTHDPECISCHVVGWHPTEYFPYETGFLSEQETPHLVDVGCETCHGPGENHVKAEMGADEALQKKFQQAMVVTKEQSRNSKHHWCLNCHDLDNSPDFNFDTYWPKIEHSEDIWGDEDDK